MFGINKNGTKHKIGIIMPAFFPASRVTGLYVTHSNYKREAITNVSGSPYVTPKNGFLTVTINSDSQTNAFYMNDNNTIILFPTPSTGTKSVCVPIAAGESLYWGLAPDSRQSAYFVYVNE